MNKQSRKTAWINLLVLIGVGLAGCNIINPPEPKIATEIPNLLFTQAAQTILAQISQGIPTATITLTPGPPTETPTPTHTYPPTETGTPTIVPPPSNTPTLTPTDTPTFYPAERITDDFSLETGWVVTTSPTYNLGYANQTYRIYIDVITSPIYSVRRWYFSDVRLEVDAQKFSGPDDGYYGLVCRFNEGGNYYALVISPDGSYGIAKSIGGVIAFLEEGKTETGVISGGNLFNHIRAECFDSTLKLFVNDRLLVETEDRDLAAGWVGLIAGTRYAGGFDARFDNFLVLKP